MGSGSEPPLIFILGSFCGAMATTVIRVTNCTATRPSSRKPMRCSRSAFSPTKGSPAMAVSTMPPVARMTNRIRMMLTSPPPTASSAAPNGRIMGMPWTMKGMSSRSITAENLDRVQVLTVSVDSSPAHKVWAEREGYLFPLLSDFWPHGAVAQAYGVFNSERGFA